MSLTGTLSQLCTGTSISSFVQWQISLHPHKREDNSGFIPLVHLYLYICTFGFSQVHKSISYHEAIGKLVATGEAHHLSFRVHVHISPNNGCYLVLKFYTVVPFWEWHLKEG